MASSLSNFELNLRAAGRSQVCVGKKSAFVFAQKYATIFRTVPVPFTPALSFHHSSCCCTFPFPHAPKSTKNFLLSTRKKAATKHTQNFCHMRRKQAAVCGMGHAAQDASGSGQAATRHSPTVTRSGMTNFTIYCEIRTQS